MKPIEPGCLVMLVKARPMFWDDIGRVFTVAGPEVKSLKCRDCPSTKDWPLTDGTQACGCGLIRLDDDPDSITEPVEQEGEA